MKMKSLIAMTALLFSLGLVTGCSEGGIGGTGGTVLPPPPPGGSSDAVLVQAGDADQYNQFVVNSLNAWSGVDEEGRTAAEALATPFPPLIDDRESITQGDTAAPAGDSAFGGDVAGTNTGTNLVVAGVDEADKVKFDGERLYLANREHVTVLELQPEGESRTLANLKLETNGAEFPPAIDGLYLDESNQQLVVLSGRGYFGRPGIIGMTETSILPFPQSNEALIRFVDIAQPEVPANESVIAIEGRLIDSRRIGDRLILLTTYTPDIKGFQPFATDEATLAENQKVLDTTDFAALVPQVVIDGAAGDLFAAASCLIPNPDLDAEAVGYPSLSSIVSIDLASQSVEDVICLADDVTGVHLTERALYLASPGQSLEDYFSETTFHKFDLTGAPVYSASVIVAGSFWGDPTFLMGEKDDALVVITTRESDGESRFTHRLSVLAPDAAGDRLEVVGAIPNDTRPEAIGKPNEQIFASRIFGDRAYVVTFERIDPVYAIDLSDSRDPQILGELEIPGFSSYLHPVGKDYLIGIGTNVREGDEFLINDGVNVRLFDVRDPANIRVAGEAALGRRWSYSPVAFDYKAFTYQVQTDGRARFALPVYRYGAHLERIDDRGNSPWTDTALHLFEVETAGEGSLVSAGQVTAENHATGERFQPGCCSWQDRSFFSGDSIYYLSKSRLFADDWLEPGAGVGNTFIATQFPDPDAEACVALEQDPLRVALVDLESGSQIGCGTSEPEELLAEPACTVAEIVTEPAVTAPGSYSVTASLPGYQPRTVTDVLVTEGTCGLGTTYLNLYLEPEAEE